jgi:hypothetical protein
LRQQATTRFHRVYAAWKVFMADAIQRDLVNLDDATQAVGTGAPGSGDTGNETIINAAEMFQQQLEQMTQWKTQLSTQMGRCAPTVSSCWSGRRR